MEKAVGKSIRRREYGKELVAKMTSYFGGGGRNRPCAVTSTVQLGVEGDNLGK